MALKLKELTFVFGVLLSPLANAYDFNFENVLIAYIKLNENIKPADVVDGYMQIYRPTVWKNSHNDEFEMEGKREETVRIINNKVANMDLNKNFTIRTKLPFDEYDFVKGMFSFTPLREGVFFPVHKCCYSGITDHIEVYFDNGKIVNGLKIPKEQAKTLLSQRRTSYGSINRDVYMKINFLMKESTDSNKIIGHISNVEVYDKEGGRLLQRYE